ncbi:MAG: glycosyltransferase family 2 protein, partial [Saprospiraceae bacterium]
MDFPLKISIITATYNSAATVRDTLESVRRQSYGNIEHIIIDGASSDTTLDIVKEFPHVSKVISEPDKGIYDAMNKGVDLATGDIVGILNSDDFFPVDDVVEQIAQKFQNNTDLDATIGDVNFVQPKNLSKIIRHYSASKFNINRFEYGFMPPHPSFYVKKSCYQSFGTYQVDYHIASDYELLIRFLYVNKLTFEYIPKIIVTM